MTTSHRWRVPPHVPTARVLPSGEKATDRVRCGCSSAWSCVPLATSHRRRIPLDLGSSPLSGPAASSLPSGEKASGEAAGGFQFAQLFAGGCVPEADHARPSRGQRLAVRGEDYRMRLPPGVPACGAVCRRRRPRGEPCLLLLPTPLPWPASGRRARRRRSRPGPYALPRGGGVPAPVVTSHRRTAGPSPPDASTLPSGEKDKEQRAAAGHFSLRSSLPVVTSHSRMVLSQLPEASTLPSGEKDNEMMTCWCPSRVRSSLPVATSHSRTALGFPSGSNQCFACVTSPRGQRLAVRREGYRRRPSADVPACGAACRWIRPRAVQPCRRHQLPRPASCCPGRRKASGSTSRAPAGHAADFRWPCPTAG